MQKRNYQALKAKWRERREKIRSMAQTMSHRAIAKLEGISEARVSQIVSGK